MRTYLSLIITAIFLSFLTAYLALNLQKDQMAGAQEIQQIKELELRFQSAETRLLEIDLSSMYPTRDSFQLIQPIVNTFHQPSRFSKKCGKTSSRMTKSQTTKMEEWESYRCRESKSLSDEFFQTSPFIHESGVSYAYLAFSSGMPQFSDISWLKKHLNFFHVSELHLLPSEALDSNFKVLSEINQSYFDLLILGKSPVLVEDYFLSNLGQKNAHHYLVFERIGFDKYFRGQGLEAEINETGKSCYYVSGNICWQKDTSNLLQMLRPSSIIIFVVSILILILVSLSLYSRIRNQSTEEERKRHALRVLTHELRTPIANLLLQIESINAKSETIAPEIIEELLKIEGEVYRLKRLAEKSSSYLSAKNEKGLVSFQYKTYESINEFFSDILDDYDKSSINFSPLKTDEAISLDGYWFNICLKNLIENALKHGKAPVSISLSLENDFLKVEVMDQGSVLGDSLEELMDNEGIKSDHSGLGMGLSIVNKIMKEMGGKLSYTAKPTVFSLTLRRTV